MAGKVGSTSVLCLVDLDRFKSVNDRGGRIAGDEMLIAVAKTLRRLSPPQHVVARLGGDEFAVLMMDCDAAKAEWFANRLIREIRNQTVTVDDQTYQVGASMGGVLVDANVMGQGQLLHQADMACYRSKQRGRNRFTMGERDVEPWLNEAIVNRAG